MILFYKFRLAAEYFEVPLETIKTCYKRNRDEIDSDGTQVRKLDFWKGHFEPLKNSQRGSVSFKINDEFSIVIPNSGTLVLSKRAILRIAMLLRDSEIAQEVRTQLLNTFEHSTDEQRTADIDEETRLMLEIGRASMSGDMDKINMAYANAFAFKNRHIAKLEESKLRKYLNAASWNL
jgi:hypothetical protein